MEQKKPKFKCRYCGHPMSLKMPLNPRVNSMLSLLYECPHCGARGPVQYKCYRLDDNSVENALSKLDLRMAGSEFTIKEDVVGEIRSQLQILSGLYAGMKAGDLPASERSVKAQYETFKSVSFRKKGQSFFDWIKCMKDACTALYAALSYRSRSLSRFAEVKNEIRRLQKELEDAKKKNKSRKSKKSRKSMKSKKSRKAKEKKDE